jgi:hypothetical protein
METGKVTGVVVKCPGCKNDNEVALYDLPDDWVCQYSHCNIEFKLPTVDDVRKRLDAHEA